jgi:cytochrome c-type biogenesis protein CcmH/NrfF
MRGIDAMRGMGAMMVRAVVVMGLVAVGARGQPQGQEGQVAPRFPAAVETEAAKIFNSTMSPFCPGLLVANCPSPGAARMKERIRIELAAGVPPDSVRALLRAEYGDQVDAVPSARGFGLLAWATPVAALVGGGAVVIWWLRRRGREPVPAGRAPATLDPEAEARLEQELTRL